MGLRAQRLMSLPKAYAFALSEAASALAGLLTDSDEPQSLERPRRSRRRARTVKVEIARGSQLGKYDSDWRDLLTRADSQNVFMQPRVLRAADGGRPIVALLAWEAYGNGRRLVGFWGFALGTPHLSLVPIAALCAPATEHAYLCAPVIDRDRLDVTLHAMFDAIAAAPDLPKLVALESMSGSGATYEALLRVLAERMSRHCRLDGKMRPTLLRRADAAAQPEIALSRSSRKKLRQYRRRLGEKGGLETTIVHAVADVRRAFEAFLLLEAKGWKGRRGTALLCDPQIADFARSLVTALARSGDASIHALELDSHPVSMQVVLRAGATVFTWKTAYDEAYSDFSPGVLLFEDYTRALLADPAVASVDSCAFDDSGYMAAWSDRQEVVDLWIDAQRGGSAAFAAAVCLQKVYLPLRETAKQASARSKSLETVARSALSLMRRRQTRGANAAAAEEARSAANGLVRAT